MGPAAPFSSVAAIKAALAGVGEADRVAFVGNLDGMDVTTEGHVFATGAGACLFLSPPPKWCLLWWRVGLHGCPLLLRDRRWCVRGK